MVSRRTLKQERKLTSSTGPINTTRFVRHALLSDQTSMEIPGLPSRIFSHVQPTGWQSWAIQTTSLHHMTYPLGVTCQVSMWSPCSEILCTPYTLVLQKRFWLLALATGVGMVVFRVPRWRKDFGGCHNAKKKFVPTLVWGEISKPTLLPTRD